MSRRELPQNGRRGVILITVLLVAAMLTVLVAGLVTVTRMEASLTTTAASVHHARQAAVSGVELAKAALGRDALGSDSFQDDWAREQDLFASVTVRRGEPPATFSLIRDDESSDEEPAFGLTDECARVNLNTATREMLQAVPNMTEQIADAIMAYRGGGEQAHGGEESGGREQADEGGQTREGEQVGGRFRTVRQLMLVTGVTPELFFGEDANSNGILDPAEDDGDANAPPDNGDGALDRGFASYLTVWSVEPNIGPAGERRTNIQSASAEELKTNVPGLTEKQAAAIVAYRENNRLNSVADLLDVTEQSGEQQNEDGGQSRSRGREGQNRRESGDRESRGHGGDQDRESRDDSGQSSGNGGKGGGEKVISQDLFAKICDYVTVSDAKLIPGKINANTASKAVLSAIPGVSADLAERIVTYREGEDGPFDHLGELFKVQGFTTDTFKNAEQHITVRSSSFSVHVVGVAGEPAAYVVLDAVLLRGGSEPTTVYYLERRL